MTLGTVLTTIVSAAVLAVAVLVSPASVSAQDKPPTLTIIMDASRSMWGQIDEVNKIVIARRVLGQTAKTYQEYFVPGFE